MGEQSIACARVTVMLYDDVSKKWYPSGGTNVLSKVQIYHHQLKGTFRVVGRRLQDSEVVINCAIIKGMKYNQSTSSFHQWRDNKQFYGLTFSSKDDADCFANAMDYALATLNSNQNNRPAPPVMNMINQNPSIIQQPVYQIPNGQSNDMEDMGYRTLTREDIAQIQERRPSQTHAPPQNVITPVATEINCAPPVPGHHRTNSAPPPPIQPSIPSAPPMPSVEPTYSTGGGPPPPPMPPSCGPPPPPMPNGVIPRSVSDGDGRGEPGSLAAALQQAKLKRSSKQGCEATSNGMYGTLGRQGSLGGGERPPIGGMASMMDEMAKTLARRRAQQEKKEENDPNDFGDKKPSEPKTNCKGSESPKPGRKRIGSDDGGQPKMNGFADTCELESFKQEMLREMKKELNKIKLEIIDAMKLELSRR